MDEQQFCLRWNNFQANITSQFEALRDDEDFTDVTIACEGQRLQAHKVVLSACSPYFKDLFKSNPCSHPIIFMRDVEAKHVVALMEFMYAGEVNVAQAQLSAFLKTAESLKIRGLTDNNSSTDNNRDIRDDDTLYLNPSRPTVPVSTNGKNQNIQNAPCSSTVTSSQDVGLDIRRSSSPPPNKRQCKTEPDMLQTDETDLHRLKQIEDSISANTNFVLNEHQDLELEGINCKPKMELPDYLSDDDKDERRNYFRTNNNIATLSGGMEIIPQPGNTKESGIEQSIGSDSRKLHSLEPRPCEECGRIYSNLSNLRQHMKLIHYPTFVSCPICTKSFKTDLYLRRHMTTTHETPKFASTQFHNKFENFKSQLCNVNVTKAVVSSCNRAGRITRGSNIKNTIC